MKWASCPLFVFGAGASEDVHEQRMNLDPLLRPALEAMGYVCWGIEYLRQGRTALLRIYIDNETGVTLEDCETVSNRVSGILDVADPIAGEYLLEVSSPGLDRLLFTPAQYEQFAGETVMVRLSRPCEGRKRITGRIRGVAGETLILDEAGTEFHIPLAAIDRARVCPDGIAPADRRTKRRG